MFGRLVNNTSGQKLNKNTQTFNITISYLHSLTFQVYWAGRRTSPSVFNVNFYPTKLQVVC